MINDPGRQFFDDQVQSQGFLFLEEYLDNIWAAAKQESVHTTLQFICLTCN